MKKIPDDMTINCCEDEKVKTNKEYSEYILAKEKMRYLQKSAPTNSTSISLWSSVSLTFFFKEYAPSTAAGDGWASSSLHTILYKKQTPHIGK